MAASTVCFTVKFLPAAKFTVPPFSTAVAVAAPSNLPSPAIALALKP